MEHNFSHVNVNEMEDLYGQLYKYTDNKVGQHITYTDGDELRSGEIVWICGPSTLGNGKQLAAHYVVGPDRGGFFDLVMTHEVRYENEPL